ncbi:MAG TPA: hypothetical protein PLX04_04935 [Caldisericia bacterium]|nr:hypothetical protein [Caldisericia bacterium]HPL89572.1 hypothetical protein [Caldisericia bacterium]HQH49742.1 hypothetical protein [Caldisericia bacterium]
MVLYEEKYFVDKRLPMLVLMIILAILVSFMLWLNIVDSSDHSLGFSIIMELTMISGVLVTLAETRFTFRIKEDVLSFGFPPFMPKIPLKEIEKISFIDDGFKLSGRVGISWSFYGGISYLTGQGDVVKVKSQGRDVYFFSVKNPQEVERILSGLIGKNKVYSDSSQK